MSASAPKSLNDSVRTLIATVLGLNLDQVPAEAMAGEFAPWTSLAHIEIMMGLEAQFDVSAPSHRLMDLMSVELIADFLREKGVKESD